MFIYIFRHGQKQSSDSLDLKVRRGVGLTELGQQQISRLGSHFWDIINPLPDIIYSSPYPRAIESAKIVGSKCKISSIQVENSLEEFYTFNDYSIPKDERDELMKKAMIDENYKNDSMEHSLREHLDRLVDFLINLEKISKSENIILSSHGATIRNLVYRIDNGYRPSDEDILNSKIQEGGYTILEVSKGNIEVISYNNTMHLA